MEVIVALAILAIALGAGLKAASALVFNAQRQAHMNAAQWCADNQLAELRLTRAFPGAGQASFSCEQLGVVYSGQMRIRNTPNPNFRRVDVQILDGQGNALQTVSAVLARF